MMNQNKSSFYIDDITWNDLSMEQVYDRLNTAESSVGQEYLKQILRTMLMDPEALASRSERAEYFTEHESLSKRIRKIFRDMGKTKKLSLYEYIFRFGEIKPAGNGLHYLLIVLLLAAIVMIFIRPVIGILALVVMFVINISTYFKYKAQIESYFMCFKYIVRMLRAASRLLKETELQGQPFAPLLTALHEDCETLKPIRRGSWLLTNSVSGSLVDVVMDYVRMLFHVDIIKFNQMRKLAQGKSETIDRLFCTLGEIEACLCISVYRGSLDGWCRPVFEASADKHLLAVTGMYHPLTADAVKNDLSVERSVLLTGSNASGKSTFLKQLAINQIFAQTIDTCLADFFKTTIFKVLSSMALTDNILGQESYFIVEIKSLKRIFDALEDSGKGIPVLCFIDEVLRGTNTRERVAASTQILKKLSRTNALCFAATHDIELTELLKEDMDNYHFEEFVVGGDVRFDYKLKKGPATTRNAIRLMQGIGFDPEIIEAANRMVDAM